MSTIIAKNLTGSDVALAQLSAVDAKVPASGQMELTLYNTESEILEDIQLLAYIQSDTLILNNGTVDLTKEQSLNWMTLYTEMFDQGPYDAVVRPSGGDYTLASAAFAAGHKSVFITNGTYVETADIAIPSGGCLVGESPGEVIIVLGANRVEMDGSARSISTGTISITHGTKAVVGVGTSFTSLQANDFIRLGNVWHSIASVTDDTNLNLSNTYNGPTLSGDSFVGQSMHIGGCLQNVMLVNGTTCGLYINQAFHVGIKDSLVGNTGLLNTDASICIMNSSECYLQSVVTEGSLDRGVHITNCDNMFMVSCAFKSSERTGVRVENSRDLVFDGCYLLQNGFTGINVTSSSNRINITDSIIRFNNHKGVNTDTNTGACVIDSCTIIGNQGDGIDFDGSENVVSNCIIKDNVGNGVQAGDNGTVTGCQLDNNTGDGVRLDADECTTVIGNVIRNSGGDGIDIPSGAFDNMVAYNAVVGSTSAGISVAGSTNTVHGNLARANGAQGILVTGDDNRVFDNISRSNTGNDIEFTSAAEGNFQDSPRWRKYRLSYSEFSAAATSNEVELLSLPPGGLIHAIKIKHASSFSGGSISGYTLSVGVSGNFTKYAGAFDVNQSAGDTVMQVSSVVGSENQVSSTSIQVQAVSTGANLDQATAGDVDIWALVSEAI